MLDILAKSALIQFDNGQQINIYRRGIGDLFQFLELYYLILGSKNETDKYDYGAEFINKLSVFSDCDLKNIDDKTLDELIRQVLCFNMPDGESNGKGKKSSLEDVFNYYIYELTELTGKDIDEISSKYNLVQAKILIEQKNRSRAERVYDMAIIGTEEVSEHINDLIGIRDMSLGEFMQTMEERLKEK